MLKRTFTTLAVASVLVTLPVANASALTAARQNLQDKRCSVAEARIGLLLTRMQNVGERRTTVYQNLKAKVQTAVDKAKAAGYDTTKLEADLASLDTAIKAYRGTTVTLYQDIQNTQNYACGESEGAFLSALQTSRNQLPEVKNAAENVQNIYQNQVKPDLQDLHEWLKNKASTTEN